MSSKSARSAPVLNLTVATTLLRSQSGSLITNKGATGDLIHSLPTGSQQGDTFTFSIYANHYISAVPTDATDVVFLAGTALTEGLGCKSTTTGATVKLTNVGAGVWITEQDIDTNWATT